MSQAVFLDLESGNGSLVVSYLAVQQFRGHFLTSYSWMYKIIS